MKMRRELLWISGIFLIIIVVSLFMKKGCCERFDTNMEVVDMPLMDGQEVGSPAPSSSGIDMTSNDMLNDLTDMSNNMENVMESPSPVDLGTDAAPLEGEETTLQRNWMNMTSGSPSVGVEGDLNGKHFSYSGDLKGFTGGDMLGLSPLLGSLGEYGKNGVNDNVDMEVDQLYNPTDINLRIGYNNN